MYHLILEHNHDETGIVCLKPLSIGYKYHVLSPQISSQSLRKLSCCYLECRECESWGIINIIVNDHNYNHCQRNFIIHLRLGTQNPDLYTSKCWKRHT